VRGVTGGDQQRIRLHGHDDLYVIALLLRVELAVGGQRHLVAVLLRLFADPAEKCRTIGVGERVDGESDGESAGLAVGTAALGRVALDRASPKTATNVIAAAVVATPLVIISPVWALWRRAIYGPFRRLGRRSEY